MNPICPWQSWRIRFLPYAESVVGHPSYLGASSQCAARTLGLRRPAGRQSSTLTAPPSNELMRVHRLFQHGVDELYPRPTTQSNAISVFRFRKLHRDLEDGQIIEDEEFVIRGRITSTRSASAKLFFFDVSENGHKLQAVCSFGMIADHNMDKKKFKARCSDLARGDIISIRGIPYRSERGELSIKATEIPKLLSPCLQPFPVDEFDRPESEKQALMKADRHIQLLSTKEVMDTIRCRSRIINLIRRFLDSNHFTEVDTPILGAVASGAIARPFETRATEFPDRRLALRIAPELWLKRLILGGFERVFEIGPAFRNEGLDKTHNPEFTTCEFYKTHADLPELMGMTESLLRFIRANIEPATQSYSLEFPPSSMFEADFPRLDFIPTLENAMGLRLPDLSHPDAESSVLGIFQEMSLPVPSVPTLPRLLDKLSSIYLEPRCDRPTFIVNHPECMSPLSKSYIDSTTNQKVSARAELFINGKEIANMYEEENSPFEQRAKFEMQKQISLRTRELMAASEDLNDVNQANEAVDESLEPDTAYLEALEWGLPPTGGWGAGIDRLVMFFAGKEKIADVLTFGSLRNVTRGASGVFTKGGPGDEMK